MKDWIMELCPEIAEWQADMIAEECEKRVKAAEAAVLAQGEPVAELGVSTFTWLQDRPPAGTKLYTHPAPEAKQEPDGLPLVIAGAIFDFAGYLTTRPKVIEVGSTANASPMADLVKEWAALRGLSLDDAAVLSWQEWLKHPAPVNTALLEALKGASNYIDKLGGVSQSYRQTIAQAEKEMK